MKIRIFNFFKKSSSIINQYECEHYDEYQGRHKCLHPDSQKRQNKCIGLSCGENTIIKAAWNHYYKKTIENMDVPDVWTNLSSETQEYYINMVINMKSDGLKLKNEILNAMKFILIEYENDNHTNKRSDCKLCNLIDARTGGKSCLGCPMDVFPTMNSDYNYGCINRYCKAFTSNNKISKNHKLAVIKFYKLAIKEIEKMSAEDILAQKFDFLIDIDIDVAHKYNLL